MRIIRKLLFPAFILIAALAVGLILIDAWSAKNNFDRQEARRLSDLYQSLNAQLEKQGALTTGLALQIANNPDVQVAIDAGDRQRVIELTYPAYLVTASKFDISEYQFHLPPGTSYLHLNKMDKYGEGLSTDSTMVVLANKEKRLVSGLEVGEEGLMVSSVVPISYLGKHLGTVKYGINFDQKALKELKNHYGSDWQLLLRRDLPGRITPQSVRGELRALDPDLLLQASSLEKPFYASISSYMKAFGGEANVDQVRMGGRSFTFYNAPVLDYSGRVIGVINIISDRTPIVQQQLARLIATVGVMLGVLLVIIVGLAYVTFLTLRPIGELTRAAEAVAAGDLTRDVPVKGRDELATLAEAFNSMTTQLRGMVRNLEERVVERTRTLEASIDVSRRLSTILEPESLVKEVVEQLRAAFGYYHAYIYLFDQTGEYLVLAGGTGEVGRSLLESEYKVPKGQGLVGRAAEYNTPVLAPDVSKEPGWQPNPLLTDTRSEIAVPISIGERVLGVLDVQENEVGALHADDSTLMQSIAAQVAIAIQNSWAYTRSQRQAEREAMVASIAQQIQSTWAVEDALKVTARELGRALGVPQVRVRLGSSTAEHAKGD